MLIDARPRARSTGSTVRGTTTPIAVALLGAVLACTEASTSTRVPAAIHLTPSDTSISQDGAVQLRASLVDSSGGVISGQTIRFVSRDTTIATVSSSGLVRSSGPVGATVVTASAGLLSDSAKVTVLDSALAGRVLLPGQGFGIGVSSTGVVYAPYWRGYLGSGALVRISTAPLGVCCTIAVGHVPTQVAFDPTGATAYVTNQFSENISVVSVTANAVTDSIPVNGRPAPIAVSADGLALFVGTDANALYRIDIASKLVTDSLKLPAYPAAIALNPSRSRLYLSVATTVSVPFIAEVLEISTATFDTLRTFVLGSEPQGLLVAPDSSELWIATQSDIEVWNLQSGLRVATIQPGVIAFPLAMACNAAYTRLYVSLINSGQVLVIDPASRKVLKTVNTRGAPAGVGFDPVSGYAFVANDSGWVDVLH